MIAQFVVEVLTGDRYNPYQADEMFGGEAPFGYIGVVDTDGNIKAKESELDSEEHQALGWSFHDARWRFATNRRIPVVAWSNSPSFQQMRAVSEWLAARGYKVASHTEDLMKWRWP